MSGPEETRPQGHAGGERPLLRAGFWQQLLAITGIFLGLELIASVEVLLRAPADMLYWRFLVAGLPVWTILALLTPLMLGLARHYTFERYGKLRAVLIHLFCLALLLLIHTALIIGYYLYFELWFDYFRMDIVRVADVCFAVAFHQGTKLPPIYAAIVGICFSIDRYRKYRDRRIKAAQLEAQLVEVQLQKLKMQLQPRFLLTTLDAIATVMHRDVEKADRMLVLLSDLLRSLLEAGGRPQVMLVRELELLDRYLAIEQLRLGHLTAELAIDRSLSEALVPNLLLQPLVELAMRHGFASPVEGGRLRITGRRDGEELLLRVEGDGDGSLRIGEDGRAFTTGDPAAGDPAAGDPVPGLTSILQRLQLLYGDRQSLELYRAPAGGLTAEVRIPLRLQSEDCDPAAGDPAAGEPAAGEPAAGIPTQPLSDLATVLTPTGAG